MICQCCKREIDTETVAFLGKTYNLCPFDMLELQRFQDMRDAGEVININWGGGKINPTCWEQIRDHLRKFKIREVLELGCGLSSELMVTEGIKLTGFDVLDWHIAMLSKVPSMKNLAKFHHYEYGQTPPVGELYPGKKWNFVFVDGPQERSKEVWAAMLYSSQYIYLHDPNFGEQSFFPNVDWEVVPGDNKLFKKKRVANHHGQVLDLLKDHFGDQEISGMEIGTHFGCLTKAILVECQNVKMLHTVDPWTHQEGNLFEAARPQEEMSAMRAHAYNALAEFGSRVDIIPMTSDEAFKGIEGELDFVWIDGDHTITTVVKDIENALLTVRPGGIVGGHDHNTVKEAIDKVLPGIPIFEGHDQTWWCYV